MTNLEIFFRRSWNGSRNNMIFATIISLAAKWSQSVDKQESSA